MVMDPKASVSALVFHHPDCRYFSVGESSEAYGRNWRVFLVRTPDANRLG